MKSCTVCGLELPLERFHSAPRGKHGKESECKTCRLEARFMARIRQEFNLTIDQYHSMAEQQNFLCAICGVEPKQHRHVATSGLDSFHVDHDHSTNTVRGLLCGKCNFALGLLKDNPEIAYAAAEYLSRSRPA